MIIKNYLAMRSVSLSLFKFFYLISSSFWLYAYIFFRLHFVCFVFFLSQYFFRFSSHSAVDRILICLRHQLSRQNGNDLYLECLIFGSSSHFAVGMSFSCPFSSDYVFSFNIFATTTTGEKEKKKRRPN